MTTAWPRLTVPAEVRWDGSMKSQAAIVTWSGGAISGWFDGDYYLSVPTADGEVRAREGDAIRVDGATYIVYMPDA